jgi:hypothetical protein
MIQGFNKDLRFRPLFQCLYDSRFQVSSSRWGTDVNALRVKNFQRIYKRSQRVNDCQIGQCNECSVIDPPAQLAQAPPNSTHLLESLAVGRLPNMLPAVVKVVPHDQTGLGLREPKKENPTTRRKEQYHQYPERGGKTYFC